jgi:hypothetical protein
MRMGSLPTVPARIMPTRYAGRTASLSAQPAGAPSPKRSSSRYLVSSSDELGDGPDDDLRQSRRDA